MEKQMRKQKAAHEDELRRIKDRQRRLGQEKEELEEQRVQEKKYWRERGGQERERERKA